MSISPPFVLSSAREPNKYTCEFGAIFLSSDLIKNAMSFLRRTTVYFCFIFLTSVASAKEGSPLTTHRSLPTANAFFTQRRRVAKGRPFGTPAEAKDCVFIIVFWLFLRINLKPKTLKFKLSKLLLTFAFCLSHP